MRTMSRFGLVLIGLVISLSVFAADENLSGLSRNEFQKRCDRLLDVDLSGVYVVMNPKTFQSSLISLVKTGYGAYIISTAKIGMPAIGERDLEITRAPRGWLVGDPNSPEKRANLMSVDRDAQSVVFRFDDVHDPDGMHYLARPVDNREALHGDVLNPDGWTIRMVHGFDTENHFVRIRFDRFFEELVSQPLKSFLASELEQGDDLASSDYVVVVEMKKAMQAEEATKVLDVAFLVPVDAPNGGNMPNGPFYYRFATKMSPYELLASIPDWSRRWEVGRIDAVASRSLNSDLIKKIVERGREVLAEAQRSGQTVDPKMNDQLTRLAEILTEQPQPTDRNNRGRNRSESTNGK